MASAGAGRWVRTRATAERAAPLPAREPGVEVSVGEPLVSVAEVVVPVLEVEAPAHHRSPARTPLKELAGVVAVDWTWLSVPVNTSVNAARARVPAAVTTIGPHSGAVAPATTSHTGQ